MANNSKDSKSNESGTGFPRSPPVQQKSGFKNPAEAYYYEQVKEEGKAPIYIKPKVKGQVPREAMPEDFAAVRDANKKEEKKASKKTSKKKA